MSEHLERQEIHRLLVEQTRELLCLHEVDGRFAFVSPSVMPLLGYRPDELLGTDPVALVHEADRAVAREALGAVLENRGSPILTLRFRRKDGTHLWIEVQTRALRRQGPEISHLVTSSRDVSDRVRLLQRVTEREAELTSVIRAFDDLVFVFDDEGRFREYDQPQRQGDLIAPPEAFLGRRFTDVLPDAVAVPLSEALRRARDGGTVQDFEYELTLEGCVRHFHAKVTPMPGLHGTTVGFVGVVRDVTERRSAEAARLSLLRAEERAKRLEGLSGLARGTAHEFNNLLTTIQANAELMLEDASAGAEKEELLVSVVEASHRAAGVTRQLLRYAGDSVGVRERVGAGDVLRDIQEEARASLPDVTVLEVEVPADAPTLLADRAALEGSVRNLVRNAFEALPEGRGTIRLRVARRTVTDEELRESRTEPSPPGGRFVAFEVEDDGEGIDVELLPRIFEPFVSTRFLGRGLGLAEVAGTVRSHRGAIMMRSQPGRGTWVQLLLPAAPNPPIAG